MALSISIELVVSMRYYADNRLCEERSDEAIQ